MERKMVNAGHDLVNKMLNKFIEYKVEHGNFSEIEPCLSSVPNLVRGWADENNGKAYIELCSIIDNDVWLSLKFYGNNQVETSVKDIPMRSGMNFLGYCVHEKEITVSDDIVDHYLLYLMTCAPAIMKVMTAVK